jgi:diphosphomevalonate decarboxylase
LMDEKTYVNSFTTSKEVVNNESSAFAPANIALCKYWGKSNSELNFPTTPSLSISLGNKGSYVNLSLASQNSLSINGENINPDTQSFKRVFEFLGLFSSEKFVVKSQNNIPTAAGLASSSSSFAALTLALDKLYEWNLPLSTLSCLARLGSGSACRSMYQGFVMWSDNPEKSYGIPIKTQWEELRIGLLIFNTSEKSISSRQAMLHTKNTSPLYKAWCKNSHRDFEIILNSIEQQNFKKLGETAEYNALSLHAVMLAARPSIIYSQPETLQAISKVHKLRNEGLNVYITQDAGPNLKLLFLEKDISVMKSNFFELEVVNPFEKLS